MADKDIDTAQILQQLKREVREQYLEMQHEVPLSRVAALEEVHATRWVNPHQPIAWPEWPSGLWPKVVALLQKGVRRLLRWYINPIVEQQNRFNAAVTTALETLARENAQMRAELLTRTSGHPDASCRQEESEQAGTRAGHDLHPPS